MSHPLQLRLSDAQAAALDAAATLTDPFTGLQHTLSRQQVLLSILDAWMVQHATSAPVRIVLEETVQAIADSAGLPDPAAEELTPETAPLPASPAPPETADLLPPGPLIDTKVGHLDKAELAARIREMRQTMSHGKIAAHLNAEGIATPGGKPGAKWSNDRRYRRRAMCTQDAERPPRLSTLGGPGPDRAGVTPIAHRRCCPYGGHPSGGPVCRMHNHSYGNNSLL